MRKIEICLGSSCYTRGNKINLEIIRKYVTDNHFEAEITFSGHLCQDLCGEGPIVRVDDRIYKEVNPSGLHKILREEFPETI